MKITKYLKIREFYSRFYCRCYKEQVTINGNEIDDLNGISWTKGCYMGQEITARMKHRNLMKKLFKIEIEFNNSITEEIIFDNKVVGNIKVITKIMVHYLKLGLIDNFDKKDFLSDSKIKIKELWWSEKVRNQNFFHFDYKFYLFVGYGIFTFPNLFLPKSFLYFFQSTLYLVVF